MRLLFFIFLAAIAAGLPTAAFGQGADNRGSLILKPGEENEEHPKSFRETLVKMRIEKEKKEFDEMIDRGEEVMKLSLELEKAFAESGRLDSPQLTKLSAVEKLVKKIRSELGGDGDDDDTEMPKAQAHAVQSIRAKTAELLEELKKTTRFTVSAAAIQTSNAVLKLVKFLKLSK